MKDVVAVVVGEVEASHGDGGEGRREDIEWKEEVKLPGEKEEGKVRIAERRGLKDAGVQENL